MSTKQIISSILLGILIAFLAAVTTGCTSNNVVESERSKGAVIVLNEFSYSGGTVYRIKYEDGLECVVRYTGGVDCDWTKKGY